MFVVATLAAASASADPIDALITEQMKVSHLPGVAVAIVDQGKVTNLPAMGQPIWNGPRPSTPTRGSSSRRRPNCSPRSC
jgi:hypothetical protein